MRAKRLAVIGHDSNEGAIIEAALAQVSEQLAQRCVRVGDFAVVRIGKALVVRRQEDRRARADRKVYPNEERGLAVLVEPRDRMANDIPARRSTVVVTCLRRRPALLMESGIEEIKAAIKPGAILAFGSRISEPMKAAV